MLDPSGQPRTRSDASLRSVRADLGRAGAGQHRDIRSA